MLTLLASFAQAESLSCSDNCKWRIRKGFEEGRASTCTMLGYRLVNGEITLIEEAEIAKRIFDLYNSKFKGEHKCETPHLDEETIKARFVTALNAIIESKDNILEDCRLMQATLTDCTGIDTEIESLLEEIDVVTELTKRCIAENSQTAQNQEEYAARYNGFVERYEKAKAQLEQLRATKAAREAQADAIGAFMFEMQELDTINEFGEKLWLTIIDTVTVYADGRMTFKFQGGKMFTSY